VLRGIAALRVVFDHLTYSAFQPVRDSVYHWFDPGQHGVFVFFLVSGYIVPAPLERKGSVRGFWVSRVFRLLAAAAGPRRGTSGLQSLWLRPYQNLRRGCLSHAAAATWLRHPHRIRGADRGNPASSSFAAGARGNVDSLLSATIILARFTPPPELLRVPLAVCRGPMHGCH
jgi:hypothetical protein